MAYAILHGPLTCAFCDLTYAYDPSDATEIAHNQPVCAEKHNYRITERGKRRLLAVELTNAYRMASADDQVNMIERVLIAKGVTG